MKKNMAGFFFLFYAKVCVEILFYATEPNLAKDAKNLSKTLNSIGRTRFSVLPSVRNHAKSCI